MTRIFYYISATLLMVKHLKLYLNCRRDYECAKPYSQWNIFERNKKSLRQLSYNKVEDYGCVYCYKITTSIDINYAGVKYFKYQFMSLEIVINLKLAQMSWENILSTELQLRFSVSFDYNWASRSLEVIFNLVIFIRRYYFNAVFFEYFKQ